MPMAPAKPCNNPRCHNLQPCSLHPQRKAFESSNPRRRYGSSGWQWQRTVDSVITRDGGRCRLGLEGCTLAAVTADHIVSPRAGGSDHESNLRAACRSCNTVRMREQSRGREMNRDATVNLTTRQRWGRAG